ncbi:hypothetical protein BJY00DRAFT_313993 [Aspergillus carlsbadensis]|nr:hypothetical protein BJY00DRAFT_313993 [Aspergillus carlsbadensis]
MVDADVMRCVNGDLKNEYCEGPYVKAIERLPAISLDYDGSLKKGRWPEDVELKSLGFDPDEVHALEHGLGHAIKENKEHIEFLSALRPVDDGRLAMLPRMIFSRIASYLDRVDILSLSLTSKGLYTLTEKLLYSTVTLTSNDVMMKFTRTLASRPSLFDLVLRYSIKARLMPSPARVALSTTTSSVYRPFTISPSDQRTIDRTSAAVWLPSSAS